MQNETGPITPPDPDRGSGTCPGPASRAEAWLRENAEAIAARRDWARENGLPLEDLQVLRLR